MEDDLNLALQDILSFDIDKINPKLKKYNQNYKAVILTGANGYIGVHLLDEIIKQTDATIYALIRGDSINLATEKLNQELKDYNLDKHINSQRVKIIIADIAQPQLGIADNIWEDLAGSVDAVYHNGAYVHHLQTYERMRSTNVGSVIEIIKLASYKKLKRIHYISTKYSNFTEYSLSALEGMPSVAPPASFVSSGYSLTKWASEWILWKASSNGICVDIYRLGQISGNSKTGVSNYQKNNLTHFFIGCIQMGFAPLATDANEFMPVDYTAKAIIALSQMPYTQPQGWHLSNPDQRSYGDFFKMINNLGYPMDIIDVETWYKKLGNIPEDNALHPLIPFHNHGHTAPFIKVETKKTQAALEILSIGKPPSYKELMPIYFDYWKSEGLLS